MISSCVITLGTLNTNEVPVLFMRDHITYGSFDSIDSFLNISGDTYPHTELDVDMTLCLRGDSKIVQSYWDNLSEDERADRLSHLNGRVLSQQTKDKIAKAHRGKPKNTLHKGGTLIKDGECITFTCISHFCKEHRLSSGHLCELLQGKRKSVKGWKLWAP